MPLATFTIDFSDIFKVGKRMDNTDTKTPLADLQSYYAGGIVYLQFPNQLGGGFYGNNYDEVAGNFRHMGVVRVFGAKAARCSRCL